MNRSGPAHLVDVYRAQLQNTFAIMFQYRVTMLIWMIGLVLEPLMYLVVWTTVAGSQGGSVGGYDAGGFAAYFLVLMIVNQLTFTWVVDGAEWKVREGHYSPLLLRPIHPIHRDIGENVTYKALTLVVLLPIAVLIGMAFDARLSPPGWAVIAFVPALLLAYLARFVIDWTVSLLAFWVTRMSAINQTYAVVTVFLTGQIAPLELFPMPVRVAASVLPFRWLVSFPVELLLGRLTPRETLVGLGMQALWLGLGLLMLRVMWRAGVRRYGAVGA